MSVVLLVVHATMIANLVAKNAKIRFARLSQFLIHTGFDSKGKTVSVFIRTDSTVARSKLAKNHLSKGNIPLLIDFAGEVKDIGFTFGPSQGSF